MEKITVRMPIWNARVNNFLKEIKAERIDLFSFKIAPEDKEVVDACFKKYFDCSENNGKAIKLTATTEIRKTCGAIRWNGYTIAYAYDRDSGAKTADNVIKLSGKIKSGGSRANWQSIISENSEFLLRDIPVNINYDENDLWKVEIVENKINIKF